MHGTWSWFVANIWPNIVWGTPAFVIHHVLLRRHITRTAAAQQQPPAPETTWKVSAR